MREKKLDFIAKTPGETEELGFRLGKFIEKGDVICLSGDLGTGKTVFVGGIAKALGIEEYVTSPTFTLVNEYGNLLYHFDVYRLENVEDAIDIGFYEYLENGGIVVVEWPEIIEEIIPDKHIEVNIKKTLDENEREIEISFFGDEKYKDVII